MGDMRDMSYETIRVRFQKPVCFVQFHRPESDNAINSRFVAECCHALALCEESITVVVLEGLPEVFCCGADFRELQNMTMSGQATKPDAEPLYDLWKKLATGPYVTIAHVRGKANAGGLGFVAASDIVLANATAQFGLSELLFGLLPACVLPFLIRRIGLQKAHYLTLMTQPISVQQAQAWGLVDVYHEQSDVLLSKHVLRLKRLSKTSIRRYKQFVGELDDSIISLKSIALDTNRALFSDRRNLEGIVRYVEKGLFPWED